MAKRNNIYVKPQLCKEFGITERVLTHLTELNLVRPDWQYRHGLQIVDLSERDRRVLMCAKNSPYNEHPLRMPFQRFLLLRFMQMPLDLIQFELEQKNLFDCSKFSDSYLSDLRDRFLLNCPEELHECLLDHRPPKNKEEREVFDTLLDVCEVRVAYEHPEWDTAMAFMNDMKVKTIVDCALSTVGTFEQIALFLHEVLGVSISPEGLLFYQQLLHDMSLLTPADIKAYFKGIHPSRRQELQRAHGTPLDVYKVQSGLQVNVDSDEIIETALSQVARKVLDLATNMDTATSDETYRALRAFNVLLDRRVNVGRTARTTVKETAPEFLKTLSLAPQPPSHGKILIPDGTNVVL